MIPSHKGLELRVVDREEDRVAGATGNYIGFMAPVFLSAMGSELGKYACWDLAPGEGRDRLACEAIRARCSWAGFAWLDGQPLAMAWINPIGSSCGELHFLTCRRDAAAVHRAGRRFVRLAQGRFKSLLCLVPGPLIGVHALARKLGFRRLARLRGACEMRTFGKPYDGILYLRESGETGLQGEFSGPRAGLSRKGRSFSGRGK